TGTGTSNTITKWTGTTAIGNSSLTDDGTTVAYTGAASSSGTAAVDVVTNNITTNTVWGLALRNTTAGTSGVAKQYSPGLYFRGNMWDGVSASISDEFLYQLKRGDDASGGAKGFTMNLSYRTGVSGSWTQFYDLVHNTPASTSTDDYCLMTD